MTKLYMLYKWYYSDDESQMEIKGVWDDPQNIIDYFNSEWKKTFDWNIKHALEYDSYITDESLKYITRESSIYVMTFNLNEIYGFGKDELSYNYMTSEQEKKGAKRYDIDEFFKEFGAGTKFAPDPKVIEETNKQINEQIRLKEFTGPSLEEKMSQFRKLYRDLVKHGVIHGAAIVEIRKNGDITKI